MYKFWKNWGTPEPFNDGYLPEEGGHCVYFAEYGNPRGRPVLFFHGGPGGCSKAHQAKKADLARFRVILFDQRGCGKSLPAGETKNNTSSVLLEDAERLLNYLNINGKIIVGGGSWGATLALLFAEKYPHRVGRLLLSQVFLANEESLAWEIGGNANFYPEFAEEMRGEVRGWNDVRSYADKVLNGADVEKQRAVLNHYCYWERIIGSLCPQWGNAGEIDEKSICSARIFCHYAARKYMLKDNQILKNIAKIKDIPTVIVHNRLDFCCPLKGAYELHKALANSRLVIVPERGHVGKLLSKAIKREFAAELKKVIGK